MTNSYTSPGCRPPVVPGSAALGGERGNGIVCDRETKYEWICKIEKKGSPKSCPMHEAADTAPRKKTSVPRRWSRPIGGGGRGGQRVVAVASTGLLRGGAVH